MSDFRAFYPTVFKGFLTPLFESMFERLTTIICSYLFSVKKFEKDEGYFSLFPQNLK